MNLAPMPTATDSPNKDDEDDDDATTIYDVLIVGGGITGLAVAAGLVRRCDAAHGRKIRVVLLDRSARPHPVGASLALFPNGLAALRYLSGTVADKVSESAIPIETMLLTDVRCSVLHEKKPPVPGAGAGAEAGAKASEQRQRSVHYLVWYLLQQYLAEELEPYPGILQMGCTVESIQVDDADGLVTVTAWQQNQPSPSSCDSACDPRRRTFRTRVLIGADGIHSTVREQVFGAAATRKHASGKVMFRGIVPSDSLQRHRPPARGVNVGIQGDEPGKLFSYRETAPGLLTVTSMARWNGEEDKEGGHQKERNVADLSPQEKKDWMRRVFAEYPAAVQEVLDCLPATSVHVDVLRDIDVVVPASRGPVLLIGDSAHAMSPSLGQGCNLGLESAAVLVHALVHCRAFFPFATASGARTTEAVGGDNNDDEANVDRRSLIASTLTAVWQGRIERVRAIHGASRARSRANNESSAKTKTFDLESTELENILATIDNWEAPVDVK